MAQALCITKRHLESSTTLWLWTLSALALVACGGVGNNHTVTGVTVTGTECYDTLTSDAGTNTLAG